jgi:hypothetical protein
LRLTRGRRFRLVFSCDRVKKGPPEDQRPKSREETPKEGYEARAISLRCTLYNAASHNSQGFF